MAIVTSSSESGDSTFTLTNGSTTGRALVVLAKQDRNPANLTGFSFDGVNGTTYGLETTADGRDRTLAVVWHDADLPASAGTYNLARLPDGTTGGTSYGIVELSGMDANAAVEVISDAVLSTTDPLSLTFTNSADAFLGMSLEALSSSGVTVTGGTGQTDFTADSEGIATGKIDSAPDNTLSVNSFAENDEVAYTGIAIAALPTSTTGSGSHQAAVATHSASGDVGTLQVSLDLVDVSNTAAPNNTGITAVVYDAAGGTEIHETATASITSGAMVVSLPSGTTANNGDEVFVKLHKAGASFNDDLNGAGRATVTIA